MRLTYIFGPAALALFVGVPAVAHAEDEADDPKPAATEQKPTEKVADHADPATQTLPSHASATAQANAFGQQGAREKAAHAAAKAAGVSAARWAAHDGANAHGAKAEAGKAHGHGHGNGNGLAHAAAVRNGHANR